MPFMPASKQASEQQQQPTAKRTIYFCFKVKKMFCLDEQVFFL